MTTEIRFYSTKGTYGPFSNFSKHSFQDEDGNDWPTSEHYFQAKKYAGTEHEEEIRNLKTPREAADMGRDRSLPLRKDWEDVKDDYMFNALIFKFTQNEELEELLKSTGDAVIIEDSPTDYYWGCGKDGTGQNRLGKLLMELREELRKI